MGKEFIFLQELGSNTPGFLELESQKKGTQKVMHNLDKESLLLKFGNGEEDNKDDDDNND